MFRNLARRIVILCLLFVVGTEPMFSQQLMNAHLHFLKWLAAEAKYGKIEGKSVKQFLFEEEIYLIEGDLSMLNDLLADSTVLTEIAIADGKRCAVSFSKDNMRVFTITYPANYQLIFGVTLMEAENRLFEFIRNTPIPPVDTTPISPELLTQQSNSFIYVKKGSSYIIPELNSNRYYVAVEKNNTIATDTLSSLLIGEKIELECVSVNEVGDSADVEEAIPPIPNNKRECWLLSFIKRIFGCHKSHLQEADSTCEAIRAHEKSDSLLYVNPALPSDSVIMPGDSLVFELLYSEDMPVESMANLVTGTDIDDSISIDILLVKYGYRTEQFTVSLRQWITFCIAEGCQPYFGVISQDSSKVVCELIMHNELFGYAHVMKLTFNPIIIAQRKGIVKARLNSYVPINKLKSLFDEDE